MSDGGPRVGLPRLVDGEGQRLRPAGQVPRDVIVAPNSPSARAHASTKPAAICGRSSPILEAFATNPS